MSHKIRIIPSDHEFTCEGRASVLAAGLRDGINLDHHCANGACGGCKARLVEGRLETLRVHDFRLSDAEKAEGWFLMCCHRAVSDLLIQTHESDHANEIPQQHIVAKVGKLERLRDDVVQLSVRTPRSKGLQFLAGQGVNLHLDGMRPERLPIASCPCDSIQLRFHVRQRAGDPFSELVFGKLKKGREVVVSGPVGDFTLDEESSRPVVFVAWESGFAPIASLIDHLIQKDPEREIHLYWLSGLPDGHYLANYCRAWQDALDAFHYQLVELQSHGDDSIESTLRRIASEHGPLAERDFYLALPAEVEHSASGLLCELGLPAGQLKLMPLQHP